MRAKLMAVVSCVLGATAMASADVTLVAEEGQLRYGGEYVYNLATGETSYYANGRTASAIESGHVMVDSMPSEDGSNVNAAFSRLIGDAPFVFGDFYFPSQGGVLNEYSFAIFNSASSTGAMTSFQAVHLFMTLGDDVIDATVADFDLSSSPLALGFYGTFTVTGVASQNLVIPETGIQIRQDNNTQTGSTRYGLISVTAPTVGSPVLLSNGANPLFLESATLAPGNYTLGNPPIQSNVSFRLASVIIPEPATLTSLAALGLAVLARRR